MLSRCDGVINLNFISDRLEDESTGTLKAFAHFKKFSFIQVY